MEIQQFPNVDIWFEDEYHFQQYGSRCTMWIPPEEKDPTVFHAPTRRRTSVFGAVNLHNGQFVSNFFPVFNAITFIEFLKQLLLHKQKGKILTLVLDNSRYHHANLFKTWLQRNQRKIQLLFLPPYSPDLNPIETVWKLTRKMCTHNRYFPHLDDLMNLIQSKFDEWTSPNEQLAQLCVIN